MFGLFKKKSAINHADKVWMTVAAMNQALMNDIRNLMKSDRTVLLFYYFKDSGRSLEKLLNEAGISFSSTDENHTTNVVLVNAFEFSSSIRIQSNLKKLFERQNGEILFTEHYPLLTVENKVLETFEIALNLELTVPFYLSLDAPLMQAFGSERILELMKRMGHDEQECIEHAMITKSVSRAQQKVEKNVGTEIKTHSAEEWFRINTGL